MLKFFALFSVLGVMLVSGCVNTGAPENGDDKIPDDPGPGDNITPEPGNDIPSISETITLCDSLCNSDASSYCEEERTILVNDVEVTGTCRAFARKGNVPGFKKCQRFCRPFDKANTFCSVNEETDENCDGVI